VPLDDGAASRAKPRAPLARLFAAPAARLTAAVGGGILGVSLVAGAIRVLPLLLAPGVPLRLAPVLARGVAGVALETALFVAPPIAWALAGSRLVDRGEARALFAIGVRPLRIVAAGWPAALGVAVAAALAAAAWGREAAAPGRAARALLAEARAACVAAPPPAVADVPLLEVSWLCFAGQPPRAVGAVPGGAAFSATAITVSDDLRAVEATDLELLLPPRAGEPQVLRGEAHLHAAQAVIRGLTPVGRASNLAVTERAALVAASATALAALAGLIALTAAVRSRAAALALGAVGPAAALLVFSALERGPAPLAAYAAVPAAGLAALLAAGALAKARAR
jgi:hypothetical protein